tara:strand:+ start:512 stop:730 length:219 start_codon:yes stop_codon:yes gene_type:complete
MSIKHKIKFNKIERDMKPMTLEEEYRNADVPMPNDMLNASNTEKFVKKQPIFINEDEKYCKHLARFFKGEVE